MRNMTDKLRSKDEVKRDLFFHHLTPERKYPFMTEVWAIMVSFGNIAHCIDKSVEAMHEILYSQMKFLLFEAEKIAKLRLRIPSKGLETTAEMQPGEPSEYLGINGKLQPSEPPKNLEITHEDILFLMRPYRVKIKRLLEHLRGLDTDTSIYNALNREEVVITVTRVDQCLQFLAEIQDCGEFTSILDEDILDLEMKRILERRDLMTKFMTQQEYDRYQELLPKTTFCSKSQKKFKKWLLKRIHINSENVDISELAITILQFLARETIANVTDMAFHIKAVKRSKKRKHENEDDGCSKKVCLKNMKLFSLPDPEEVMLPGDPVDAAVIGEGVVMGLNNMFFKHTEKLIKGETLTEELYPDVSDFSEDFKTLYVYQSKITREEVIDAYMQFQYQRKPWLHFGDKFDTFWKNTTLICLANVDDHKVP